MKKLLLIFSMSMLMSCSQAEDVSNKNAINVLKSSLGDAFSVNNVNKELVYRYCPDNTCEEIMSDKNNYKNLNEFSLLYFYYASGYVYLKMNNNGGSFIETAQKHVKNIVTNDKQCGGDEYQVASCIMLRLLRSGITGISIRYDENIESKMVLNLKKLSSIDNLHRIVSWREGVPKENN